MRARGAWTCAAPGRRRPGSGRLGVSRRRREGSTAGRARPPTRRDGPAPGGAPTADGSSSPTMASAPKRAEANASPRPAVAGHRAAQRASPTPEEEVVRVRSRAGSRVGHEVGRRPDLRPGQPDLRLGDRRVAPRRPKPARGRPANAQGIGPKKKRYGYEEKRHVAERRGRQKDGEDREQARPRPSVDVLASLPTCEEWRRRRARPPRRRPHSSTTQRDRVEMWGGRKPRPASISAVAGGSRSGPSARGAHRNERAGVGTSATRTRQPGDPMGVVARED